MFFQVFEGICDNSKSLDRVLESSETLFFLFFLFFQWFLVVWPKPRFFEGLGCPRAPRGPSGSLRVPEGPSEFAEVSQGEMDEGPWAPAGRIT